MDIVIKVTEEQVAAAVEKVIEREMSYALADIVAAQVRPQVQALASTMMQADVDGMPALELMARRVWTKISGTGL